MGLSAEKCIFQQDKDQKHTSLLVKNWILRHKFRSMKWLPQSSDMSPIESKEKRCSQYLDYQIPVTQLKGPKGNGDMQAAKRYGNAPPSRDLNIW